MRSVYSVQDLLGGTNFVESPSIYFRIDKKLSDNSGLAIGEGKVLHFDGLTDKGRDLYNTTSKGWCKKMRLEDFHFIKQLLDLERENF